MGNTANTRPRTAKGFEAKPESPIDHFILSKINEAGNTPAPQAGPQELVRRIYLDLHGLPPTQEQSERFKEAFHNDPDTAWKKLVDELLEHRRYGERWASHWLDVVRYAESDGYRAMIIVRMSTCTETCHQLSKR